MIIINCSGVIRFYNNAGQHHRSNGLPATTWSNGDEYYLENGKGTKFIYNDERQMSC